MKKLFCVIFMSLLLLTGCESKSELISYDYNVINTDGNREKQTIKYYETNKETNNVVIDTSKGKIIAELYPNVAPITVRNFKGLIKSNFYSNMVFHRVIKNFMIQTGDPTGTGTSGSKVTIKGEFSNNGVKNDLSHTRGVLSMARTNEKDSASSQFFIVQKDAPTLDGQYASFGKVIAGLEVVDSIANVQTNSNDKPVVDQKLNSIKFIEIEK